MGRVVLFVREFPISETIKIIKSFIVASFLLCHYLSVRNSEANAMSLGILSSNTRSSGDFSAPPFRRNTTNSLLSTRPNLPKDLQRKLSGALTEKSPHVSRYRRRSSYNYKHKHLIAPCKPSEKTNATDMPTLQNERDSTQARDHLYLNLVTPSIRFYERKNSSVHFLNTVLNENDEDISERYARKEGELTTLFRGLEVASQVRERNTASPYVYPRYPPVGTIGPYGDKFFKDFNKDSNRSRER